MKKLREEMHDMKERLKELEDTMAIQDEEISGYKNDAGKKSRYEFEIRKKII